MKTNLQYIKMQWHAEDWICAVFDQKVRNWRDFVDTAFGITMGETAEYQRLQETSETEFEHSASDEEEVQTNKTKVYIFCQLIKTKWEWTQGMNGVKIKAHIESIFCFV